MEPILSAKQKATVINENPNIYGTFAEIGAGQETVRSFFRAGGASNTIAKAISAYDKDFSDAIYGIESDGRYVTENRLRKMLTFEIELIENRLDRAKHPDKLFFTYANTVATIHFAKNFKGHGWVGLRFQMDPLEGYNEVIMHIRFHQIDARVQQETLGMLGVNLVYGCFYHHDNPKKLLASLYDNLHKNQIEIDMINFSGPRFAYVDNRLMSLQLVKNEMTEAVLFGPDGFNLLPAQVLYKKNILALRGSFRPVTKVNIDMFEQGYEMFIKENKVDKENTKVIFEITLSNLRSSGTINERDFLDRAEILSRMGHSVMISNFSEYFRLVEYFSRFTKSRMGLVMGVQNLIEVFNEKYYRGLSGGILEAFGKLFFKDLKLYLYPMLDEKTEEIVNSHNLKLHPRMKELYKYFKENGRIIDIDCSNKDYLNIYSREVLKKIGIGEDGWEEMLPDSVTDTIKSNRMFGFGRGYVSKV